MSSSSKSQSGDTTIAYADCFAGISGDMFLGALINAGLPVSKLKEQLTLLDVEGWQLETSETTENAIKACHVRISVEKDQPHRTWKTIQKLIKQSTLQNTVKDKSHAVFLQLATAEAKVHGCKIDDVHFHEVGAVDSIIDIVGTAIGLEYLNIDRLDISPLPMSQGFVLCDHGLLPLPAPAVCEILRDTPVYGTELQQELVTPTGAAIAKTLGSNFGPMPAMQIKATGYGAGSHKLSDGRPNVLRLIIGMSHQVDESQEVEVIETNIDDWTPEGFPYLFDLLFTAGALDASVFPVHMKKGRPGFSLQVICHPAHAYEIKKIILSETTAIGLRYRTEKRMTLPREIITIDSTWGPMHVKKVQTPEGPVLYPEYEECRKIAQKHKVSLKRVYDEVRGFGMNNED